MSVNTCAAQYVRMSTDRQDLSAAVQKAAISSYAKRFGYEIIETYEDDGRSGLSIENRAQMRRLLADVMSEERSFNTVLVYDVSRWGRFQDTDASAYYEYHCRLNGVSVVYVQEPFGLDRTPFNAVVKSMKRAMAAEYSRELGIRTRAGQVRAILLGFQMGALPCVGFRRIAVRKDGCGTRLIEEGDMANVAIERVRWVLGPPEEVALARRIFEMYARPRATVKGVASQLCLEGARSRHGRPITASMVRHLIECEAFIGNFTWGRSRRELGGVRKWGGCDPVRGEGKVQAIISRELWNEVQEKRAAGRNDRRNRQQLLDELREAVKKKPTMSSHDLGQFGCACRKVYERNFGSMTVAFRAVGRDDGVAFKAGQLKLVRSQRLALAIAKDICRLLEYHGAYCARLLWRAALELGNGTRVRVQCVWERTSRQGVAWETFHHKRLQAEYALIARMREDDTALDFFLVNEVLYPDFPVRTKAPDRPEGAVWINTHTRLATVLQALGRSKEPGANSSPEQQLSVTHRSPEI